MSKIILLLTFINYSVNIFSQEFENPYVESNKNENISISKVVIEKNRTVIYLKVKNTSTSEEYSFTLAGTDTKEAHYLYDPKKERKYIQKFSFGSAASYQSTRYTVYPLSSETIKLIFQKLDSDTKSFDMYEGSNSGRSSAWDFKGIKLMSESELQEYKKQKADEQAAMKEKEAQEKLRKEQENIQRQEQYKKQQAEQQKNAEIAKANADKERLMRIEQFTINQTVKAIEYDGAYVDATGKYYFMKPVSVSLGRFGRCVGGSSDFNLMRTYFIANLDGCVVINTNNKRIILSGSQNVASLSNYKLSELRDFSKEFGMCVWNLTTNREHSFAGGVPTWTPKLNPNDITQMIINEVKTKSINGNRAEIFITETLKKGTYYVLFNNQTTKYFIFYVK